MTVLWLLAGCGAAHAQATPAPADIRAGDVVFQDSGSRQGQVIQEVTGSQWSHVGVVLPHEGAPHVLEAISPVSWTPLSVWLARARGPVLVRRRARPLSDDDIARLVQAGTPMVGRPYDSRFEWGEMRIYCSELVFLLFERALGVRLVEPQRWRDLNLGRRGRALARRRLGHLPPSDGLIVTPAALAEAASLTTATSVAHTAQP